jgi:hypothetical protein
VLNDAVQSGKVQIIGYPNAAIGDLFLSTAYFCAADYGRKNVEVLAHFRRAPNEATMYANANPAKMVPLLAAFSGIDPKVVAKIAQLKQLGLANQ